ncbi:MAG TPA: lysylphosphatidylglycerol synthase transmembrane domain-containing protein [bacterium]|nr:lysylphosphatidylglycerol synthase transmembrane domain-containing protein [bacterium]HPQ66199.1 lysylphosphatidylglycerol synthase transmembrane domain-containing protein [bacterium]
MKDGYEIEGKGSWKKRLFLFARLAVSFGLIGYIVYQIASRQDISAFPVYYEKADWLWLGAAVLSVILLLSGGALRWGLLLRAQGVRLSKGSIFMYFMIGMFFNNFLPSTVGGDAIKIYYLHRFAGKGKEAFVSVLLDRLLGIAGLCIVAVVSLALGWRIILGNPHIAVYAWMIFGVVGGLTVFLGAFFLVIFNDRIMGLVFRLIPVAGLKTKIRGIHDSVLLYRGQFPVLFKALAVSVAIWVFIVLSCWMIYRAFYSPAVPPSEGTMGHISIGYFYLFLPTIAAIMSVPISFGGVGTREAFFILFFGSLPGIGELGALMISLNYYLAFLLASSIGGFVYIAKDQLRFHRELPQPSQENGP